MQQTIQGLGNGMGSSTTGCHVICNALWGFIEIMLVIFSGVFVGHANCRMS